MVFGPWKSAIRNPQSTMVENAPFLTHQHGGLTVEGYSRAAVQSYWRVPELKLGFDLGGAAVGLHGDADVAGDAHAAGSRGGAGLSSKRPPPQPRVNHVTKKK